MTAMVTPFGKDGNVDYELLKKLIDHLLSTGTDGILVSGTTGEGPTLTEEEKIELIEKYPGRGVKRSKRYPCGRHLRQRGFPHPYP